MQIWRKPLSRAIAHALGTSVENKDCLEIEHVAISTFGPLPINVEVLKVPNGSIPLPIDVGIIGASLRTDNVLLSSKAPLIVLSDPPTKGELEELGRLIRSGRLPRLTLITGVSKTDRLH
jgi:hypothetical protein